MRSIQAYKIDPEAVLPTRNLPTDAGLDIYASADTFIPLGHTRLVQTGVALRVEEGYVGKIEDRSSMAKRGIKTGGGVVDAGFAGPLNIILHNLTNSEHTEFGYPSAKGYWVRKGDRIAQMLVYEVYTPAVVEVTTKWNSERGSAGFGSSGR